MNVVETTKEKAAAQQLLPQQSSKEESEAILTKTNELILQLDQEKQTLQANSQKREEEEEEQWVQFQSQYDNALKQKQQFESALQDVEKVIIRLEFEREKVMELKTNKETEEEMAQWQVKYDDAVTKKNEAELKLKGEKERLSELRGVQSAYLKEREEEDDAIWKEFQERYDAALKEKADCEAALVKIKEAEEEEELVMMLHGEVAEEEEMEEDGVSSSSPLEESSPQSQEDDEDNGAGGGEDASLITTDLSAITPNNSDTAEMMRSADNQNNNSDSVGEENNFIGEVSTITESQEYNFNNNFDGDELNETRTQTEASTLNLPNHMMAYDDGNSDDTSLGATTLSSRHAEYKKDLSALDKFPTITESQECNVNNVDGDELNETRTQEEASTLNLPNHMMAYDDGNSDDTSLGATTLSSRHAEYKKDLSALDKFPTITESQECNVNNVDGDELNETRTQEEASTLNLPNHMMAYDDGNSDDTSLGATTLSSRHAEYKKDLAALDKFLPPADDENSFVSGRSSRSISSRSVRRRDVIKPMDLDEISSSSTLPSARGDAVFVAKIDGTVEEKPSLDDDDKIVEQQSNPQCDQQFAMVVRDPKQRPPRPTNLEPEEGRAALYLGNDPPGETPNERPYIDHNDDAINDSSSGSDTGGWRRRSRYVQWVDPKDVQDEDIDFGLLSIYERMAGRSFANGQSSTNSSKGQQRSRTDPPEDLPKNNYFQPEEDDDSSSSDKANKMTKASILGDNKRIRIATISSGYKTANYFVREDLDTRIYFHELEEAVNYMTRRGYARMKKEDEEDWQKLIGRAHGVVKIGPTKKKQRYRKGKLLMVLSKEINDNDDYKKTKHDDYSNATEHTSLGRSVRCGFKSYSEKFLAEQEADKQSRLLQLTNGEGVDRAGHLLQLTNGDVLSAVDEATLESSKASTGMGSDRKGVYGGGVRYFTSDNNDDESSDHHSDESEAEEEEEEESGVNVYEEFDEDYSDEEQEEMHEVEGSMGSMFSEEESFRDNRSTGIDSVSESSTLTSGHPTASHRKGTYRRESSAS